MAVSRTLDARQGTPVVRTARKSSNRSRFSGGSVESRFEISTMRLGDNEKKPSTWEMWSSIFKLARATARFRRRFSLGSAKEFWLRKLRSSGLSRTLSEEISGIETWRLWSLGESYAAA